MSPSPEVTYQTPDGKERSLRFSLGARRRIAEAFGKPDVKTILDTVGDGALPSIAYCMMFDQNGDAPAGLNERALAESLDDPIPLLAAIMSAVARGATPKNELEARLREAQAAEVQKLIGTAFAPSPISASDSPSENSGGSPTANTPRSVTLSATANGLTITAPDSPLPLSTT